MSIIPRRRFLQSALAASAALAATGRKMKIHLTPGSIGVKANQLQTIEYAERYGYEAVEPDANYLATLSGTENAQLLDKLRSKNLVFGNAGLSVDFRKGDEEFRAGMAKLPGLAKALERAGVTRVSTWIMPTHDTLTYVQNLRKHAARLRECAMVLADHNQRLGLEYVGPKTLWTSRRYPFVHSMAETKDLLAEIGKPNVGFLLDSWHWYTAGETEADILTLKAQDIVSVDLNDAPAGIPVDQQKDSARELPMATGVIDLSTFLNTLNRMGYDGPVRPEPFNAALRAMPPEQALEVTAQAMRKAFSLIR